MRRTRVLEWKAILALGVLLTSAVAGCNGILGPDKGRVVVLLSGDGQNASASVVGSSTAASSDAAVRDDDDDDDDDDRSDKPSRWFQAANVRLASVLVRNLDGELVGIDMDLPVNVDIVKLENGKQIQLPDGVLPVGDYDQVVVVITAVQGIAHDGSLITVEPAGGGWTAIVPICPLEVGVGGITTVGLDLNVRDSFWKHGNRFSFQPRFRSHLDCLDDGDDG